MDEKMQNRYDCLSRMTTKNGASSNEEQIAQRKMKLMNELNERQSTFEKRMGVESTKKYTKVHVYYHEDTPEEVNFRSKFEAIKEQNRKKWGS